jgi:hypothetical protein
MFFAGAGLAALSLVGFLMVRRRMAAPPRRP